MTTQYIALGIVLFLVALSGLEVQAASMLSARLSKPHEESRSTLAVSDSRSVSRRSNFRMLPNFMQQFPDGTQEYDVDPSLKCGVTNKVDANTDKWGNCPADCPFFAQNRKDDEHCTFLCVTGDECKSWNPNKPIADDALAPKTCRGPVVQFCSEYELGGSDKCIRCQSGWKVWPEDGKCYFSWWRTIYTVVALIVLTVIVLIAWVVDMCCRETINEEGVEIGHRYRSMAKIHKHHRDGDTDKSEFWEPDTNLCVSDVGGPGMLLHFRFQAFLIAWPLFVAMLWTILALFHNELFYLGTRQFGTPRSNCILVAWGYETQNRLMWTKVLFLAVVYAVSFITFLMFSISQYRKYQDLDAEEKTMKDFAMEIKGIPALSGSTRAEEDISNAVKEAGKKADKTWNLVGVSICWEYDDKMGKSIMEKIRKNQVAYEETLDSFPQRLLVSDETIQAEEAKMKEKMSGFRKWLYEKEIQLLDPPDDDKLADIETVLHNLSSSDSAFVVFDTERERDEAVATAQPNGMMLKIGETEFTVIASAVECEPLTVNWHNYSDPSIFGMVKRFCKGFVGVYLPALAVWFFIFYVPYAWSLYNFNYDNGAQLPSYYGLLFTMIVVGGNATMYFVCDMVGDVIGFRYKDSKQVAYMIMYLAACMINVLLDMVVTWFVAEKTMEGLDFRTYHGRRLSEIDSFTDKFESYAMQRSLAENTYVYAFPSTFLVPFILEPVITISVPYALGKLIVRTHRSIQGASAEAYLAAFEFDLGRYADILLNVFLGIVIFWFPGGYTWSLFYGMFVSHIIIYLYDHYRVLSVIPTVKIVSKSVDWWAQVVLGACCAMILSALVFKANCAGYGYCMKDMSLVYVTTLAGIAHFVLHTALLIWLVPLFGKPETDMQKHFTYKECAEVEPYSFFSTNPVHCLRSQSIYQHKPHCRYATVGKENLQELNPSIGCYYLPTKIVEEEDYSSNGIRRSITGTVGAVRRISITSLRSRSQSEVSDGSPSSKPGSPQK